MTRPIRIKSCYSTLPRFLREVIPPRHRKIPDQKFGPNGERLCRWCEGTVPKPRRTFCSQKCVDDALMTCHSGTARQAVYKRDRGICVMCGCNATQEFKKWLETFREVRRLVNWLQHQERFHQDFVDGRWQFRPSLLTPVEVGDLRRKLEKRLLLHNPGWTRGRSTGFDVDHILPVFMGGGSCGLDNLQTLCHPCHKRKSKANATERATRKGEDLSKLQSPQV